MVPRPFVGPQKVVAVSKQGGPFLLLYSQELLQAFLHGSHAMLQVLPSGLLQLPCHSRGCKRLLAVEALVAIQSLSPGEAFEALGTLKRALRCLDRQALC